MVNFSSKAKRTKHNCNVERVIPRLNLEIYMSYSFGSRMINLYYLLSLIMKFIILLIHYITLIIVHHYLLLNLCIILYENNGYNCSYYCRKCTINFLLSYSDIFSKQLIIFLFKINKKLISIFFNISNIF